MSEASPGTAARSRLLLALLVLALAAAPARADAPETSGLLVLGPDGHPLDEVVVFPLEQDADGLLFDQERLGRPLALDRGRVSELAWDDLERPAALTAPGAGVVAVTTGARPPGVRLLDGATLSGRLVRDEGEPAGGVVVIGTPERGALRHRTRTDADGRWRLLHLPHGPVTLAVRREDGGLQPLGVHQTGRTVPTFDLDAAGTLAGQVLEADTSDKAPVEGVTLRFVPLPRGAEGLPPAREVTTGEDGRFLLEGVMEGAWEVELRAPALYLPDGPPRVSPRRQARLDLRPFFVRRRPAIRGRVLGPDEVPVEDVEVHLLADPASPPPPGGHPPPRAARTDEQGAFVLQSVRPEATYRLLAAGAGLDAMLTPPFRLAPGEDLEVEPLRLAPGWPLEVVVHGPDGERLAGARVRARPATIAAATEVLEDAFAREGETDEDGQVVLRDLGGDAMRLTVEAKGLQRVERLVARSASSAGVRVAVDLVSAPDLAGRVVVQEGGSASGLPGGLRVRLVAHDGTAPREVAVAADGTWRVPAVRVVPTDVLLLGPDGDPPRARRDAVVPGTTDLVELVLPQPGRLTGTVQGVDVDAADVVLSVEAPVVPESAARTGGDVWRWRTVRTLRLAAEEADLPFVLEDLPPGVIAVRATQGRLDSDATPVRLAPGGTADVLLQLPAPARIAGTVLGPGDAPVLGATVRVVRLRGDGDAPGRPGGAPIAATDETGAFAFEGLAPGLWRVEVEDGMRTPDVETVRLREGDARVLRDLRLGGGGTVVGRLLDEQGRAVEGARLALESEVEGIPDREAVTSVDGAFRVEEVRPGPWRVRVVSAGGSLDGIEMLVTVRADAPTVVDLAGRGEAALEGRVTRDGVDVGGVVVRLHRLPDAPEEGLRRQETTTDAAGSYAFAGLAGGRYVVDVLDGVIRASQEIVLASGDTRRLDLVVWPGRIEGRVVTHDGEGVGGATVVAQPVGDAPWLEAVTRSDATGSFVLPGLPVGRWDLHVSGPGLPPGVYRGAVAEVPGAVDRVEVVVGRGGTLVVEVAHAGGGGVTGARVWLEDPSGAPLHRRPYVTPPRGRLVLEGVPAGRWGVRVHAPGLGRPPPRLVTVPEGGEAEVGFLLEPPGALRIHVQAADLDPVTRTRIEVVDAATEAIVARRLPLRRLRRADTWEPIPLSGILELDDLAPGRYLVRADAGPRFAPVEIPALVEAGRTTDLPVHLERIR